MAGTQLGVGGSEIRLKDLCRRIGDRMVVDREWELTEACTGGR